MIKTIKKLVVILMVLFTALNVQTIHAKASNSYTINGVTVQYYDFSSAPSECWRYANNMYTKIWGTSITATSSTCNILEGLSASSRRLTKDHLQEFIGYAPLGSAIRLTSYEGLYTPYDFVGHSQILVQKDEHGFTILEGGMSCPGSRRECYYTWDEYLRVWSKPNYHYIKYIICPNSVKVTDIDKEKEEALLNHMELMEKQEEKNEKIERVLQVENLVEQNTPVQVAYEKSVEGHITTLNRCTMSFMFAVSTVYFYIYKKNSTN